MVQASLSSQTAPTPGWQAPKPHLSPKVHLLPSSQVAVFAVFRHTPADLSHESSVQSLPSSQFLAAPGLQAPAPHTSPSVHGLLSEQADVFATFLQTPVATSQLSLVQPFVSSQFLAAPGLHAPPLQTSPTVHALASSQAALLDVDLQAPVVGSHASSVHKLPSLQSVALPDWHLLAAQTSPAVHALPSSQLLVLATLLQLPVCVAQESVVQPFASSQLFADPDLQPPPTQTSPTVHWFPSSQAAVFAGNAHLPPTHESSVQAFPSLQSAAVAQFPPHPVMGLNTQFPL